MLQKSYSIHPLSEGAWSIEMDSVRVFLVAGETSALLIDTGTGGVDLRSAVRECTALPIRAVNTHSHFDHISGNSAFEMIFSHPMEISSLAKAGFKAHPVNDGSGFDLGGRILQVIGVPGHSPGNIALWDAAEGLLFTGDTVLVDQPVLLCLDGASLEAYIRSLSKIIALENDEHGGSLRRIFCSHGEMEANVGTVQRLKKCAEAVDLGKLAAEPVPNNLREFATETTALFGLEGASLLVKMRNAVPEKMVAMKPVNI